jgi:PIN domain nuclease of toxin-antitoxin system
MIFLDTHVLFWAVAEPRRLSREAARTIEKAGASDGVGIASASLFELADLFQTRRIRGAGTLSLVSAVQSVVSAARPSVFDVTGEIACAATELPPEFSPDPMDRLIAATARVYGYPLVTRDQRMRESPLIRTIW